MAATRLSDSQKSELVARFRGGAGSQELAEAFGCSPNTVIRVAKAALEPGEYEQLKQQRGRHLSGSGFAMDELAVQEAAAPPAQTELPLAAQAPAAPIPLYDPRASNDPEESDDPKEGDDPEDVQEPEDREEDDEDGPGLLAIDDADDFGAEEEDDLLSEEENGVEGAGFGEGADDGATFLPIPVVLALEDQAVLQPVPLASARLPASAYMLVDKTVELQARPLSDFPELGRLPAEEQGRQALVVFVNPRQAKRQCGRTQRVIKIPDPSILERTAPYLLAQGISRVVIEGGLYALPGS